MFQKILAWLIGKKIVTAEGTMTQTSKAKVATLLGILLPIVEPLSTALKHPIHISPLIYQSLTFAGLWGIRDGMNPTAPKS